MKHHLFRLGQWGQTAVEYLLMLAVSIGLGITFTKKVQAYLVENPDSYINNYLNSYRQIFNSGSPGGYKRYRLPR